MEHYDPCVDQWTLINSMSVCRGGVGVGTLGGRLFAIGGHDSINYLNSVEAYDPDTNRYCCCRVICLLCQVVHNFSEKS